MTTENVETQIEPQIQPMTEQELETISSTAVSIAWAD